MICSGSLSPGEIWRGFEKEFSALSLAETELFKEHRAHGHRLYGHGEYGSSWRLVGNKHLKAEFLEVAARAGRALCPSGCSAKASDCWMYCLYLHMRETDTHELELVNSSECGGCGTVRNLLSSSKEFCLWISQQISESAQASTANVPASALDLEAAATNLSGPPSNRDLVERFLITCNRTCSFKVIKADIWRAVGHKTSRQFEYWQRGQKKFGKEPGYSNTDDTNFRRIVEEKTAKQFCQEVEPRKKSKYK